LKNLDFNKKSLNQVVKPDTPHNTSQYLSSNFCQGRNEKAGTILNEFTDYSYSDIKEEMLEDYMNEADDYCIPGGSMKGKINNVLIFYI
jgi:hypothetical protein